MSTWAIVLGAGLLLLLALVLTARLIASDDHHEPFLTLEGLRLVHGKNVDD